MMDSSLCIGIDLGTTNSCVAYYKNELVEILENKEGGRTTPSCVLFSNKNPTMVGEYAKKMIDMKPEHGVYEIKRLIGRDYNDPNIQNNLKYLPFQVENVSNKPMVIVKTQGKIHENTPTQLSSYILKKLKNDVEEKLGQIITKAVITVPAYFSVSQREATLEAATKAGFTVLKLLNEPTAAAVYYYHKNEQAEDENYSLVYDLGGGTFDVAILKKTKDNIEIVGVDGDSHLGGDDFDNLIAEYVCKILSEVYGCNQDFNRRMRRRLKNKCEDAKKFLSTTEETDICLEALFHKGDDPIEIPLTRKQFEEMGASLFKRTIDIVEKCLKDAKLTKSQIKEIILSGGSTRIPKIQEMISSFFNGKTLNKFNNPDECVAQGAALQAALLSTHEAQHIDEIKIIDVVPLSLGIENFVGETIFIVKRNTPIPTNKSIQFFTIQHKQQILSSKIFEGERLKANKNYILGTIRIDNLTPAPPGECEVTISMNIDQNGILTISAKEKLTNNIKELKVAYTRGHRSNDEIHSAVRDARQNEDEDLRFLQLAKKRRLVLEYCYAVLFNLEKKQLVHTHQLLFDRCEAIVKLVKSHEIEDEKLVDTLTQEIIAKCKTLEEKYNFEKMPEKTT